MLIKLDGEKIKFLCKKHKITMQKLADDLGVCRQTLGNWCRLGTTKANILYVVDYFNIADVNYVILREEREIQWKM